MLICRLLTEDPNQRLGAQGAAEVILAHEVGLSFMTLIYIPILSFYNFKLKRTSYAGEAASVFQRYKLGYTS